MLEIVQIIVPVFGIAAVGFAAAHTGAIAPSSLAGLRFFLVTIALPALIFQLVSTGAAGGNLLAFALTATFATYCAFAIAFTVAALLTRGNVPESTIQGLLGANGELVLLGLPLALAAFGSAAAVPTAVILVMDGAMLAALTPLMMALGGSGRIDLMDMGLEIARRVVLNPLFLATIAGLLAAGIGLRLPGPIDGALTLLRQAAPAVALFLLGAALPFRKVFTIEPELPALLVIKLLAHPLIAYLLLSWVGGFDRVWVRTAVLLAALPPAAELLATAKAYDMAPGRVASTIQFATAASVVTVTIVLWLLVSGVLPVR